MRSVNQLIGGSDNPHRGSDLVSDNPPQVSDNLPLISHSKNMIFTTTTTEEM